MPQQNLLGTWEQWSRLVDFIPLVNPTAEESRSVAKRQQGKHKHLSIVYAQANQTLSQVYQDTLQRCEVADEQLTQERRTSSSGCGPADQSRSRSRTSSRGRSARATGEPGHARVQGEAQRLQNAVIDYAARLARANGGSAAEHFVEWQRSGGVYRRRATEALRDWIGSGSRRHRTRAGHAEPHPGQLHGAVEGRPAADPPGHREQHDWCVRLPVPPRPRFFPADSHAPEGWSRFEELNMERTVHLNDELARRRRENSASRSACSRWAAPQAEGRRTSGRLPAKTFGMEFWYRERVDHAAGVQRELLPVARLAAQGLVSSSTMGRCTSTAPSRPRAR